ncbi:hypothetical protein BVRB_6g140030 isoform C [Beta vulgaris subsp. vulgaris]|nr:hypothetical protein BVRB_6g140030 isoform C [Beta vulgaris subsp. vulgaris]
MNDVSFLLLGSLCKYLMVASGRAFVFINRARAQTIMKAWDHAVGMICVHEAGGKLLQLFCARSKEARKEGQAKGC